LIRLPLVEPRLAGVTMRMRIEFDNPDTDLDRVFVWTGS
jgi:hypothetical protein